MIFLHYSLNQILHFIDVALMDCGSLDGKRDVVWSLPLFVNGRVNLINISAVSENH